MNCGKTRLKEKLLVCQIESLLKQRGGPKPFAFGPPEYLGSKVGLCSALMVPPPKAPIITVVATVAIIVPIIPSENSSRTSSDLLSQFRPCL